MCGIAGYIRPAGLLGAEVLGAMIAAVQHRGPDGDGLWTDPQAGIALGHRRLKVLDLTDAADQPMISADGRFVLTYNGEIYNFRALREELVAQGATFTSTGDTAVLFELCRRDPELSFLPRLNGMFAFALWDAAQRTLTLVRDRNGVKPLLYAQVDDGVAFASEMAAVRPVLAGREQLDTEAVIQLLSMGFIIAPRTIFTNVRRLQPGHLFRWADGRITYRRWAPQPTAEPAVRSIPEAVARLRDLMRDAVSRRMLADVPVGLFLSGGIDSSVVTAVAAQLGGPTVRTFSVGFPEHPFFDETRYARAVAERCGTDHTELPLTLDDVRNAIPTVLDHLSEPFADSSALPTYLLSALTRRHVTVALSGDGADELFAGYRRYAASRLVRRMGWFSHTPLYRPIRMRIETLPTRRETKIGSYVSQLKRAMRGLDPDRRQRYANWQRITDTLTLATLVDEPAEAIHSAERVADELWQHRGEPRDSDDLNAHLRTEWRTSLPDDMLMKVDLMSMAHGLEVRSPFLDFNVVDFVQPLPADFKLRGWRKKYLLLRAYRDDLPPLLHRRPKKGFEVPVGPWLRGPLYDMARELIGGESHLFDTLLSRDGALEILDAHRDGQADHTGTLWALVALLWWQRRHAPNVAL